MKKLEKLKNMKANHRFADGKCIHFPKKLTKVAIVLTLLLFSVIATASLILFFGEVETELDIKSSVTIDNQSYEKPIKHKFKLQSGDSISVIHTFRNNAKTCNVMINQTTSGLIQGVTLRFYDENNSIITFPFRLNTSSNIIITMTYHADINLKSQKVKIISKFSVSEI